MTCGQALVVGFGEVAGLERSDADGEFVEVFFRGAVVVVRNDAWRC